MSSNKIIACILLLIIINTSAKPFRYLLSHDTAMSTEIIVEGLNSDQQSIFINDYTTIEQIKQLIHNTFTISSEIPIEDIEIYCLDGEPLNDDNDEIALHTRLATEQNIYFKIPYKYIARKQLEEIMQSKDKNAIIDFWNRIFADGNLPMIDLLIKCEFDGTIIKQSDINTKFFNAVIRGNLELVQILFDRVNKDEMNGNTALIAAAKKNKLNVVKYLVENGVDKDKVGRDGTALMVAAEWGYFNIVKYLVDSKADLDRAKGEISDPSLSITGGGLVMDSMFSGVPMLVRPIRTSQTPLILAAQAGYLNIVEYLVRNGADKNKTDSEDYTALMEAAKNEHFDIVKYLVDSGADITLENDDGYTALDIAEEQEYLDIANYLKNAEAALVV